MCTVTLIAARHGYALGMNRDEQRSRVTAQPPAIHRLVAGRAMFPSEPGGGTWIGVSQEGVTFALLNWYAVTARVTSGRRSRGEVIPSLLGTRHPQATEIALAWLDLDRMNPFRLVGVFPASRQVVEWRWDLDRLRDVRHPWTNLTWVSSGMDEPGAQRIRGRTFREALLQPDAGHLNWLRRLHRSHSPEPGPYSHCMHREHAASVSYTEVLVGPRRVVMRGVMDAPCCAPLLPPVELELVLEAVVVEERECSAVPSA